MDKNGLANINELIKNISKKDPYFDKDILFDIVQTDNKKRYLFNEDKTKIRANQGHSMNVDVELKEAIPPDTLYHGTSNLFINSIKDKGLLKRNRLYVHLSDNYNVAINVDKRHGDPIVLYIDAKQMVKDGYKFYLSKNLVWLVEFVPFKHIRYDDKKLII